MRDQPSAVPRTVERTQRQSMSQDQSGPYGIPPHQPYPPPPSRPPGRGGRGRTIALVAGAFVLVGAVAAGGVLLIQGKDRREPSRAAENSPPGTAGLGGLKGAAAPGDGKRYRLTAPETILGGTYKKDPVTSRDPFHDVDKQTLAIVGITDAQSVGAAYKSGTTATSPLKLANFGGLWGGVKDPEATVDNMFRTLILGIQADPTGKPELEGSPRAFKPDRLDGNAVMKCQKMKTTDPSLGPRTFTVPVCIWADNSTVGVVSSADAETILLHLDPSLDKAADVTARIRQDVRVEIAN
ncbi:hypothetical protein [Streptomyces griseocarneus]|uniref:hypothetical protein n=1 Tax=Streptomyces griseocarneus TaxID=51201 RepID=UPI00167D15EA|nr:hypothetical protein [Streptomyces griseocarneus]MBZ6477902.1 hypothetical protein [Streptomyces griseocarneus]GHG54339.1 hypothetical protein GCM10018779_17220 [Streptomyces griseocarneus]